MTSPWRSRVLFLSALAVALVACVTPHVAPTAPSTGRSTWAGAPGEGLSTLRVHGQMLTGEWAEELRALYGAHQGRLVFIVDGRLTAEGRRAFHLVSEAWSHGIGRPAGWEDGASTLGARLDQARLRWEQVGSDMTSTAPAGAVGLHPVAVWLRAEVRQVEVLAAALDVLLVRNLWRMARAIGVRVTALRAVRPSVAPWPFDSTPSPEALVSSLVPSATEYEALRQAYARYVGWVERGRLGPAVFAAGLALGARHDDVARLRDRLAVEGIRLAEAPKDPRRFDEGLREALQRFQHARGLSLTGALDRDTRRALDRSPSALVAELELGLVRWHASSSRGLGRHVRVNIPRYEVQVMDGGEVRHRWPAMVGRGDRQTPLRHMTLKRIVLYPTWFGRGEIRPVGPGPRNPLGRLVMRPKRPTDLIYIHGTNEPHLFRRPYRAYSRGCIRMAEPEALAAVLLDEDPGPEEGEILPGLLARHKLTRMELHEPVHLVLDYNTTYVAGDVVFFARDIYGRNARERSAVVGVATAASTWRRGASQVVAHGR